MEGDQGGPDQSCQRSQILPPKVYQIDGSLTLRFFAALFNSLPFLTLFNIAWVVYFNRMVALWAVAKVPASTGLGWSNKVYVHMNCMRYPQLQQAAPL
jgi:hypothetical protein